MRGLPQTVRFGALALIALLAGPAMAVAADETPTPCTEDAMIVFDASGSMAGSLAEGIGAKVRRIDEVRKALAQALPRVMLALSPDRSHHLWAGLLQAMQCRAKSAADAQRGTAHLA